MSSRVNDAVRTLFKSGGILLVGLIFQLGFSFVSKVIIARVLPRSDFGGIALATTVAMVAAMIAELGLPDAITRYLPRASSESERRGVLATSYTSAALAVAFGLVIFITAPTMARVAFGAPEMASLLRIFAFVVPLGVTHQLTVSTFAGLKRTVPKVLLDQVLMPLVRFAAVLAITVVGVSATRMALAYLIGWLIPTTLGLLYIRSKTPLFDRSISFKFRHREFLTYSLPLLLANSMTFVFNDLDTLMLGYFTDTSAVAVYNVVYPIGQLLTTGLSAFGFVFMPIISELHAEGAVDDLTRIYQVVTKWVFVITLPVFLVAVLFPTMTITITFGSKYQAGATTLSILAVGFFVSALLGLNSQTLSAVGQTRRIMYVNGGGAVLNTALNLALIPTFGYLGAGIATATTFVALNVGFSALVYRELGIIPVTRTIVRPAIVGATLVGGLAVVVKQYLRVTPLILIVFFVVFLVAYAVLLIRFGVVEAEEVMLVHSIEERFGVDFGALKRVWSFVRGYGGVNE